MKKNSFLKIVVAFGLLAIVLIVLGVNFVPRIFASPSNAANNTDPSVAFRSNYTNEGFQRSIASQLSLAGSDWIERHPVAVSQAAYYAGSDWIERHPASVTQAAYYAGSDWIERHPSTYFAKSDYYERHPNQSK